MKWMPTSQSLATSFTPSFMLPCPLSLLRTFFSSSFFFLLISPHSSPTHSELHCIRHQVCLPKWVFTSAAGPARGRGGCRRTACGPRSPASVNKQSPASCQQTLAATRSFAANAAARSRSQRRICAAKRQCGSRRDACRDQCLLQPRPAAALVLSRRQAPRWPGGSECPALTTSAAARTSIICIRNSESSARSVSDSGRPQRASCGCLLSLDVGEGGQTRYSARGRGSFSVR